MRHQMQGQTGFTQEAWKPLTMRVLLLIILGLPTLTRAQFTFTTNNAVITIISYNGPNGAVFIPTATNGYPVKIIGPQAFQGSGVTSVTIGNSVTNIGSSAFDSCNNLTNIIIGTNVSYIGTFAFGDCPKLPNIILPDSVSNIDANMFFNCAVLTNVNIGKGITTPYNMAGGLGPGDFAACPHLLTISVSALNPTYSSAGGVLFDKYQTTIIAFPEGISGSYSIPATVTTIPGLPFPFGSGLTNVTIPSSVTTISGGTFAVCPKLLTISVNAANPAYSSLAGVLFDKYQTTLVSAPGGLAGHYTMPNSVTNIATEAFYQCTNLNNVLLDTSLISIGVNAFDLCVNLTNMIIPGNVNNIGYGAFYTGAKLASVYFVGNAPANSGNVFYPSATLYYLPHSANWSSPFSGAPAVLWNPQAVAGDGNFGVHSNAYGFNVIGNSNIVVVVEACTNLASPAWTALQTLTLTNGFCYFSDPQWTNYPSRFYGFAFP